MVNRGRKKIGILFNFSKNWLGGVYYIQNIIKALEYLDDIDKPKIIIFHSEELTKYAEEINYPHLELVLWDFINIYKGYVYSLILRKNVFIDGILKTYKLNGVYPLYDQPIKQSNNETRITTWFPDLQHKFYPNYFKKSNIFFRELRLKLMLKNSNVLVVSSEDVSSHFEQFYDLPKNLKIHVLPFVSIIDGFKLNHFDELKIEYNLPEIYYIVSNQFYEHKNHMVVFKAIKKILDKNKEINVVFTGIMKDYRNPLYIEKLKSYIEESGIKEKVHLLGNIPREHQLCLIKNSKAVIQPSLFEGWSTVIEDAKSLQTPVIASDISVHKEQLEEKGFYFDSLNELSLMRALESFSIKDFKEYEAYENRIIKFANNFVSIYE